MAEWQPMETVPKDGRQILLFQDGSYVVAKWKDMPRQEQRLISSQGSLETYELVSVSGGLWDHDRYDVVYDPTHWMELPEPPK